jgi:Rrf2 family protein
LRAAVWIAAQEDAPQATRQIAAATQVPAGYLAKVLQALGRAGVVRARRGIGGGFVLGRAADQITILEVIDAVDPIERIHSCPLHLEAHGQNLCPLHRRLDDAIAQVQNAFSKSTLADLVDMPPGEAPINGQLVQVGRVVSGPKQTGRKRR